MAQPKYLGLKKNYQINNNYYYYYNVLTLYVC